MPGARLQRKGRRLCKRKQPSGRWRLRKCGGDCGCECGCCADGALCNVASKDCKALTWAGTASASASITSKEYEKIKTEQGDFGPYPGGGTIKNVCPGCGAALEIKISDPDIVNDLQLWQLNTQFSIAPNGFFSINPTYSELVPLWTNIPPEGVSGTGQWLYVIAQWRMLGPGQDPHGQMYLEAIYDLKAKALWWSCWPAFRDTVVPTIHETGSATVSMEVLSKIGTCPRRFRLHFQCDIVSDLGPFEVNGSGTITLDYTQGLAGCGKGGPIPVPGLPGDNPGSLPQTPGGVQGGGCGGCGQDGGAGLGAAL